MTHPALISIKFDLAIGRYDTYQAHFAFVWPENLWQEFKSFLEEFPDEEVSYYELYGKHSRAYVTYKELLDGSTVTTDTDKVKEFILTHGHEHDFTEDFDPWDCFLEDLGNRHNTLRGEFPSWWDYQPSKDVLKQEQWDKWDLIKEELKGARISLHDYGLDLDPHDEETFNEFIDNNELQLAWDVLKDVVVKHSVLAKQMARSAKLMNISDPIFGINETN